jgi:hypothetical protein
MKFFTQIPTSDLVRNAQDEEARTDGIKADTDNPYMAAVESGDMEAAQAMVDGAARNAGYSIGPLWHSTGGEFHEFHPWSHFGTKRAAEERSVETKGGRLVGVYLKRGKGLRLRDIPRHTPDAMARLLWEKGIDVAGSPSWDTLSAALYGSGYTHIYYTNKLEDAGQTSYIVPHSSQVKSTAPATYDQGKLIPLEKRFDNSNPDIRY